MSHDYVVCHGCGRRVPVHKTERIGDSDTQHPFGERICCDCTPRGYGGTFRPLCLALTQPISECVLGLVFVEFDLHAGQVVRESHPVRFTEETRRTIAGLSFPDANFSPSNSASTHAFACEAEVEVEHRSSSGELIFGASRFTQVKSTASLRGAFQYAIVCVSRLPMLDLCRAVAEAVSDRVSNTGTSMPGENVAQIFMDALHDLSALDIVAEGSHCEGSLLGRRLQVPLPLMTASDACSSVRHRWCEMLDDTLSLIEHMSMGPDGVDHWPRLIGKVVLLPNATGQSARQLLGRYGWSESDIGFRVTEEDEGDLLGTLYRLLRSSQSGVFPRQALRQGLTTQTNIRPCFGLLRSQFYYGETVVQIQNAQLAFLLESADRVVKGRRSGGSLPVVSSTICGMELGPLGDVPLCDHLWPHMSRIFKLWEIVISGESLLVVGADAAVVSAACLAVASLISPLRFEGVLRPYLTMGADEAEEILRPEPPSSPALVGVTNPFFSHRCRGWPNVLGFGGLGDRPSTTKDCSRYVRTEHAAGKVSSRLDPHVLPSDLMCAKRHFCVKSDRLTADMSDVGAVSESILREGVQKLTAAFLAPLQQVIILTLHRNRPFFAEDGWENELLGYEAISRSLETSSSLPIAMFKSRGDLLGLYRLFTHTQTFRSWRSRLVTDVQREIIVSSLLLEDLLVLDPSPQTRFRVLTKLQNMLSHCLGSPFVDVDFVQALARLLQPVGKLRERLCELNIAI